MAKQPAFHPGNVGFDSHQGHHQSASRPPSLQRSGINETDTLVSDHRIKYNRIFPGVKGTDFRRTEAHGLSCKSPTSTHLFVYARLVQRQNACLTCKRSLVRFQYRARSEPTQIGYQIRLITRLSCAAASKRWLLISKMHTLFTSRTSSSAARTSASHAEYPGFESQLVYGVIRLEVKVGPSRTSR